MEKLDYA